MERGSDKHSPMIDEAMKHETSSTQGKSPAEARSQEGREQEGPADGEPTPDARLRGERVTPPNGGMSMDDANARADVARYLEPSAFPSGRDALVANARSSHAPDDMVRRLESLPAGETYENVQQVWKAMGGEVEPNHNAGRHFEEPPGPGMSDGEPG